MNKNMLLITTMMIAMAVPVMANEMMSAGEKVQKLQNKLDLTAEQTTQIRPIVEEYHGKMEKIKQEKHDKMSKVLSVDQMSKLYDMKGKKKGGWNR